MHILKASSYFAFLFGYKNITKAVLFNSFTTAAQSSWHNSVTTGARYSRQMIKIICNIDKQIAQNMRTFFYRKWVTYPGTLPQNGD